MSESATCQALVNKVRDQALELTSTHDKLSQAQDHILLCEKRIAELLNEPPPFSPYGSPSRASLINQRSNMSLRRDTASDPDMSASAFKKHIKKEVKMRLDHLEEVNSALMKSNEVLSREKSSLMHITEKKNIEIRNKTRKMTALNGELENIKVQLDYLKRSADPSNLKRLNKAAAAIAKSEAVIAGEELRKIRQKMQNHERALNAALNREKLLVNNVHELQQKVNEMKEREAIVEQVAASAVDKEAHEQRRSSSQVTFSDQPVESEGEKADSGQETDSLEQEQEVMDAASYIRKTSPPNSATKGATSDNTALLDEMEALRSERDLLSQKVKDLYTQNSSNIENNDDAPSSSQKRFRETLKAATSNLRDLQTDTGTMVSIGSLTKELEVAEKERDVCIDRLKREQENYKQMLHKLSQTEKALEISNTSIKHWEAKYSDIFKQSNSLQETLSGLNNDLLDKDASVQQLQTEKALMAKLLDAKNAELSEVRQIESALLTKIQEQESVIIGNKAGEKAEEEETSKARAESSKYLQLQNTNLNEQIDLLTNHVNIIQPRLEKLESREEDWNKERSEFLEELELLRPLQKLFFDLEEDFRVVASRAATEGLHSKNNKGLSPEFIQTWIDLPSLHQVNSTLHELLTVLFEHYTELRNTHGDLVLQNKRLQEDVQRREDELNNTMQRTNIAVESTTKLNEEYRQRMLDNESRYQLRIKEMDKELFQLRSCREAVNQIKYFVATNRSGLSLLQSHLPHLIRASSAATSSSTATDAQPIEHILRSQFTNGKGGEDAPASLIDVIMDNFADHMLPEIISRAVTTTHSSSESLKHSKGTHDSLKAKYSDCESSLHNTQRDLIETRDEMTTIKSRYTEMQRRLHTKDEELEEMLKLGEQQQKLTEVLEQKHDSLIRDRQLRNAQIVNMQQREEAVKTRLTSALKEFGWDFVKNHTHMPHLSSLFDGIVSPGGAITTQSATADESLRPFPASKNLGTTQKLQLQALQQVKMSDLVQMVVDTLSHLWHIKMHSESLSERERERPTSSFLMKSGTRVNASSATSTDAQSDTSSPIGLSIWQDNMAVGDLAANKKVKDENQEKIRETVPIPDTITHPLTFNAAAAQATLEDSLDVSNSNEGGKRSLRDDILQENTSASAPSASLVSDVASLAAAMRRERAAESSTLLDPAALAGAGATSPVSLLQERLNRAKVTFASLREN